jgi:hypothetical protein
MSSHSSRKFFGWLVLLLWMLSCVTPLAATPAPTSPPEDIQGTLAAEIAATFSAAQTQTATMYPPTSTATPTITPPRTPTETVTASPTFILLLPTTTAMPDIAAATYIAAGTPAKDVAEHFFSLHPIPTDQRTWRNQWLCEVRDKPHPTILAGEKFDAAWTVVNTGWDIWDSSAMDFVHLDGLSGSKPKINNPPAVIGYGMTLTASITFAAPKKVGTYNTTYGLKVDRIKSNYLCQLTMTVTVY